MTLSDCTVLSIPGCGNIASVCRTFQQIGMSTHLLTPDSKSISTDLLILPGVGSFENAMQALSNYHLLPLINNHLLLDRPTIGICLGFQILCHSSVETVSHVEHPISGLSVFDKVLITDLTALPAQMNVGPKPLLPCRSESPYSGLYYFMHRYGYILPDSTQDCPAHVHSFCNHAGKRIAAICQKNNVWGIQFHPEKSGSDGLSFLNSIAQKF